MRILMILGVLIASISTSSAAATLTASPVSSGQDIDLFTVEFADSNGNGLLDFKEITGFPPVSTRRDPRWKLGSY